MVDFIFDASSLVLKLDDGATVWTLSVDSKGDVMVNDGGGARMVAAKTNFAATTAPGINDDTTTGYSAGSIWVDVTNDKAYVCIDATDGAAIWTQAGLDLTAIHDDQSGEINAITGKTALVDADIILIEDSESTNAKKKTTLGDIKAVMHIRTLIPIYNHTGVTLGGGTTTYTVIGGGDGAITGIQEDIKLRMPKGNLISIIGKQDGGNSDCTFNTQKNGTTTALTGTVTSAGGFEEIRMTTGGPVAFADGDDFSLELVTTSGSGMTFRGLWAEFDVEVV